MRKKILVLTFMLLVLPLLAVSNAGAEKVEITVMGIPDSPRNEHARIIDAFEFSHPDIKVKYVSAPPKWSTKVDKITTYLAQGYTKIDAYPVDDMITATVVAAGWLVDLTPYLSEEELAAWMPVCIEPQFERFGGIYALPISMTWSALCYRKDWFERDGVTLPQTWDELITVAKKYTNPEKRIYGYTTQGSPTGELWNTITEFIWQAGGDLREWDSEETRKGFKFFHDMIYDYKVASPEVLAWSFTTPRTLFIEGKAAMLRDWPSGEVIGPASPIYGKVGIDVLPGITADERWVSGSWDPAWAVSKFSEHKEATIKFVKFASGETAMGLMAEAGHPPARKASAYDPWVADLVPDVKFQPKFLGHIKPQCFTTHSRYMEMVEFQEKSAAKYLAGEMNLEEAVKWGAKEIERLRGG